MTLVVDENKNHIRTASRVLFSTSAINNNSFNTYKQDMYSIFSIFTSPYQALNTFLEHFTTVTSHVLFTNFTFISHDDCLLYRKHRQKTKQGGYSVKVVSVLENTAPLVPGARSVVPVVLN